MDPLFYHSIQKVKNMEPMDKAMLEEIKGMTSEQKDILISTMNDVIIALIDVLFIEPTSINK
jgi:hypothetical protein